jgi:hypothetical protein
VKRIGVVSLLLIVIFCFYGCKSPAGEGFAIYLPARDIPVSGMESLSHVDLADKPLVSLVDVVSYSRNTHEIQLTPESYSRITNLEVPVSGKAFLVCVDHYPVYWGAFWTPISSISFDGVTIWKPLSSQDPKVIKLELGYPSSSFYGGEDPRNNVEVMESLKQAGKLTTMPSATTVNKLPHSMKGYELYSWSEGSQWYFTLVTGTNRNKTLEEIISNVNIISEDEWVHIHVVGVEAIETVLSRLPQNEYIFRTDYRYYQRTC